MIKKLKSRVNHITIARRGGEKTRDTYGKEHYLFIGGKGGNITKEKYGSDFFRNIQKKSVESRRKNNLNRLIGSS